MVPYSTRRVSYVYAILNWQVIGYLLPVFLPQDCYAMLPTVDCCIPSPIPAIPSFPSWPPLVPVPTCGKLVKQNRKRMPGLFVLYSGSMEVQLEGHTLLCTLDVEIFSTVILIEFRAWSLQLSTSALYLLSITWHLYSLQLILLLKVSSTLVCLPWLLELLTFLEINFPINLRYCWRALASCNRKYKINIKFWFIFSAFLDKSNSKLMSLISDALKSTNMSNRHMSVIDLTRVRHGCCISFFIFYAFCSDVCFNVLFGYRG